MTEDVDIAAARSVSIISKDRKSLAASLDGIGLRPVAGPGEEHPVRREIGVVLDVLTPKRRGAEASVRHDGFGKWAQALPYLDFSLNSAIDAVVLYRDGLPVRIPAPERFAIHKLIVASVRRGTHRAKAEKDLAQAAWLVEALSEARPFELAEALDEARNRGPKWRSAIDNSLARRPEIDALLVGL